MTYDVTHSDRVCGGTADDHTAEDGGCYGDPHF